MRDVTKMKIVPKGIVTPEDGELSVKNGIDGILLSNHGGRGEDNGCSTIDALPDILGAVNGQIPLFADRDARSDAAMRREGDFGAHAEFRATGELTGLDFAGV